MWENPQKAQKLVSERTRLIEKIETIQAIVDEVNSLYEMIELAEMENELTLLTEVESSFYALDEKIEEMLSYIQQSIENEG